MLTLILGIPLLAALALAFVPRNFRVLIRAAAVLATLLSAVLAVLMFLQFNGAAAGPHGFKFEQQVPWVQSLGI
ncbi:MAG TPA: hypothetical protein VKP68_18780, partial [Ramlibacter sp.]|nr:hypothetical protein [Ramlibacter sp.]